MDSKLRRLNERGIFPGPAESEGSFYPRAESLVASENPFNCAPSAFIEKKFQSTPDWAQIIVKSKGLFPWEAAATWIEETEEGVRTCQIQIKDSRLSRLYAKDEVIAHEMVHAMRLMFDESRFEEILAYQTSKNRFRRYFGPLFSNPLESRSLIVLVAISWILYGVGIFFEVHPLLDFILYLPLLALGFGVLRLARSQRIFSAALRNLQKATGRALSLALRLTDKEIELFAKSTHGQICAFARLEQAKSFRWRQIYISYFRDIQ